MNLFSPISVRAALACIAIVLVAGCTKPDPNRVQGYVEGEFVYVASPLAGQLETLSVQRGTQVKLGDPLFALDRRPETALRNEAERRLAQARSHWEDSKKGKRPTEIESLEAQLRQASTSLQFSEKEVIRQERLAKTGAGTSDDLDKARSTRDQDRHRVAQLEADLQTGKLGLRVDQIAAAEAAVRAQEAMLAKAEWDLSQKQQSAPQSGLVYDTLYRPGEWVPAGRPVVAILPPPNVKVRAFVPEQRIGAIQMHQPVRVVVDGVAEPFAGRVAFISPQAEFTPPVIYSRESRSKLVFKIEIRFEDAAAAQLHPGQPVEVLLEP